MPAKKIPNPRVTVSMRVTQELHAELCRQAADQKVNVSEILRRRLELGPANPLAAPVPRRRERKPLTAVHAQDAPLISALARIGNNLNQLVRAANKGLLAGSLLQVAEFLITLLQIKAQLDELIRTRK